MADMALQFGGDLSVGPTGDLAVADGAALTQQRVLRRLLTNPGDYIWQLDYGAGLGQYVGQPNVPAVVAGLVRTQLRMEPGVASSPVPSVEVTADNNIVNLQVVYTDAGVDQTSVLSISI